jgi:hypothetical protein
VRKVTTVVQAPVQLIFTPGANNGELATDGGANLVLIIQRLAPDFPKLVLTKQ